MLFGLLIADVVAVKEQVYVFVLRHLHSVAVYSDSELLIAAFRPVGLDFLRGLIGYHRNRGCVTGNFGAVGKFACNRGLCGTNSCDEKNRIMQAKEWLKTRKFTHIYIPTFDQQSIYTAVKKVKHTQGLDVLIVDYFKGKGEGDAFDSYQELGRFVDMVKNQICGEMNMGGWDTAVKGGNGFVGKIFERSRLAVLLHFADIEATYFMEV